MYDVPSTSDVAKVVVTAQTINEEIEPKCMIQKVIY